MYWKIPINTDLSQTSYRVLKEKENFWYIELNEGIIDKNWVSLEEEDLFEVFGYNPFIEEEEEEILTPYQPSNAEIAQMISDLQADLIIAGVI